MKMKVQGGVENSRPFCTTRACRMSSTGTGKQLKALGDECWKKAEKINGELFVLTYGALVAQLLRDYETGAAVNAQLEKIGYNIGIRIIEEYLARTGLGRCQSFVDTVEALTKVGFRMFLGIVPTLSGWSEDGKQCILTLDENPLAEFVELPEATNPSDQKNQLYFSNIICGVIRGALEMIQMEVECEFVACVTRGNPSTEIRLRLVRIIEDELPPGDN